MQAAPISGDMRVKLAMGAAVLLVAYLLVKKIGSGLSAAGDAAANVADAVGTAINPANPDNLVNSGVNALGNAVVSSTGPGRNADGSWTLGGSVYDVTHPNAVTGKWWWQ